MSSIFRGLIKCADTGRIVTAATKKKNYTNGQTGEWTYLRAWNSKNHNRAIYVQEGIILKEIEKVFESLRLEPELL